MEIGKLTNEELDEIIFSKNKFTHPNVLIGSGVGEDCSIIDFENELCVISTDPITATIENIGKLAVHVSCNDVASKGVKPFGIMITLLAPPKCKLEEIKKVMNDIINLTRDLQIQVIGGHTEITDAVNKIIISSTCLGKAKKDKMVFGNEEINLDDSLIMTKYVACEGTTILYNEFKDKINHLLTDNDKNDIQYLSESLSVIDEGLIACQIGVKSMHDVTEGGVLGAAWEINQKTHLGLEIHLKDIPILQVTRKIADYFNIDPYKLISSGVMLIVVAKENEFNLIDSLEKAGISAKVIGKFIEGDSVVHQLDGNVIPLKSPKSDELYQVYKS